ncbi:MAG: G5 domain-containing protein [Anaerolineae bacterium]
MRRKLVQIFCVCLLLMAGCTSSTDTSSILVTLAVDGQERSYPLPIAITVGEFLRQANVELGSLDEVTPPLFSQVSDGLRVTVTRVEETQECENQDLPFAEIRRPYEGLQPGEERVTQAGQSGVEEICYRVTIRDGKRAERVPIRTTIITAAQDAIIYFGPSGQLDPVPIEGTLAYISNGNVWVMRGNSTNKRLLTTSGDLDNRVFSLTADGRQLLFSRKSTDPTTYFNQLWMVGDTTNVNAQPVALRPQNVLYADWVPNQADTINYSSGEITDNSPGWQAYNDLWLMRIDPNGGDSLNARQLVDRSSGWLYSWWGTGFQWSPNGQQLAWVRADSMGLVNTDTGEFQTLLTYPVFSTRQPWSWRATVSWSPDSSLLLTTVHGLPIGSEPAETSPAFHDAITNASGSFTANVVENAGIWSKPKYSPISGDASAPRGYIAYLRARDLANSISESAEYDLVVADRDGSNARVVYPAQGQPGLTAAAPFFTWNPSGTEIAFIYGGNLWVVDVESAVAHQLTLDRGASIPIWTR